MFSRVFGSSKPEKKEDFCVDPIPEVDLSDDEREAFESRIDAKVREGNGKREDLRHFRQIVLDDLRDAREDYDNDKIFLAVSRLQKLKLFVRQSGDANTQKERKNILDELMQADVKAQDILADAKTARAFLNQIESDEGWKISHRGKKIVSYWKEEKGTDTYSFKVKGMVNHPTLNIIPLLLETDLYHRWFPMMTQSEEMHSPSRFHKIVKSTLKMPYPLHARECIIDGHGWDVMEYNRIVVSSKSISSFPGVRVEPCPKDRVRVDIKLGGFELIPVGDGRTFVTIMFNLNPKVPYLPSRVMNFFLEHVVGQIHSGMEKHSRMEKGSPYLVRKAEKVDLYRYIETRYEETRKIRHEAAKRNPCKPQE
mmetsp:Transcript_23746/g.33209  ORF Transcript_23746/g.33209 Transcript_23746/m.33209 type:complete len:367 (-) Transcript_23746:136-1236(-)